MKTIFAAAALLMLAALPAQAATPVFALVMVKDCGPGDPQSHYEMGGMSLPFCLTGKPFLTAPDITAASAVAKTADQLEPFGLPNPHVLHLNLTDAAGRRLIDLSRANRGESFAVMIDDRIISITSIGDPLDGPELELLINLEDPGFVALVKQLDRKP
jgi:hypothetical protein